MQVRAVLVLISPLALLAQRPSGNTLFLAEGWAGHSYSDIFFKPDVRPGRLLAAMVLFPVAYLLVTAAWRPLLAGTGWLLLPLGQNSLLAYSMHLPVVLIAGTALPQIGWEGGNPAVNSAIQLAGVALVWSAVKGRELARAVAAAFTRSGALIRSGVHQQPEPCEIVASTRDRGRNHGAPAS